jgi:hypothetical protein
MTSVSAAFLYSGIKEEGYLLRAFPVIHPAGLQ